MKVLVAGGTGFIGSEIVRALGAAGHEVSVLSRSAPRQRPGAPPVPHVTADVTDLASLEGRLDGFDVVVDAVQFPNSPIEDPKKGYTFERVDYRGTLNLIEAAKSAGVGHMIILGGMGATEHAPYHWLRFKWKEEQAIQASGLRYTVFRPSWVYGPGDVSLNRFLGFARFLPFVPVIGSGKVRLNPLFVEDLAAHVAAAITNERAHNRIFEIGGPDVLTMNEIIRAALQAAGKRRFLLPQPKALMKVVASIVQYLPGRPLTPDAIDFITMDPIADNCPVVEAFGLPLTPLPEAAASYLGRRGAGTPER